MKYLVLVILGVTTMLMYLDFSTYIQPSEVEKVSGEEETIKIDPSGSILHSIDEVTKLCVIEANVSDIYTVKDYWMLDMPGFKKEMIVKVKAKVAVGFDLKDMEKYVDYDNNTIVITKLPQPRVLYIDDSLDYFKIDQGYFNEFEESDLTEIDSKSREFIHNSIDKTELFNKAKNSLLNNILILNNLAKGSDWSIQIK